jgi:phosphoglucosamine mutase
MVDNMGHIVDGDELLFIIAKWYSETKRLKSGGVVGTVMSNYGLEIALRKLDIPFCRAKVGDRHVLELLKRHNWILGGESSGHILCLDANTTGDGIVSALKVLAVMRHSNQTLNALKKDFEKYPQTLINVPFLSKDNVTEHPKVLSAVQTAESRLNGQGRILLRTSGTEPVVRVMVEGLDMNLVQSLATDLASVVENI